MPAIAAESPFVSTQWLADNLSAPDLVVVDGSWHLPTANRDPKADYLERHIPGAVFFDVDGISDPNTDLPHMLPDPHRFSTAVGALGISDGVRIVVYDSTGLFSAPRVWWTFKAFGASDVKVLEGGLPKWLAEERPTEDGPSTRAPRSFTARLDRSIVADMAKVEQVAKTGAAQLLDARARARFKGEVPEPRPGLAAGHIPGSLNLPWEEIVKDGTLIAPDALRSAFAASGLDLSKPVVTTCGSGISAAILWLALETLGTRPAALYDGSWTEWGASGKEVATGA